MCISSNWRPYLNVALLPLNWPLSRLRLRLPSVIIWNYPQCCSSARPSFYFHWPLSLYFGELADHSIMPSSYIWWIDVELKNCWKLFFGCFISIKSSWKIFVVKGCERCENKTQQRIKSDKLHLCPGRVPHRPHHSNPVIRCCVW